MMMGDRSAFPMAGGVKQAHTSLWELLGKKTVGSIVIDTIR